MKPSKSPPPPPSSMALVLQEPALRYFLEVVKAGSLTGAAERMNVATSAVSRQIARLEKEMDTLLFERRARGMVPNAAGELLAVHAKRTQQDIERVSEDIQALRGLQSGVVRIVSTAGFASEFLPSQIVKFRERYRHIRFVLEVKTQSDIPRMIREGEMDIGLTLSTTSERGIHVEVRHAAPIRAILSPNHELAGQRQLSLAQLVGYPLALPGQDSTLRQLFDISCSRQGLRAEPALQARTMDSMIAFAAAGGGITLCGEAAVRTRLDSGQLVAVALRDREMNERHFEVQTMAGRTLSKACRAFLEHLLQNVRGNA